MRIFIAVFVMGAITVTAAAIAVAETLVTLLPVLAFVVAAFALRRLIQRRSGTGSIPHVPRYPANQSMVVPPARFGQHAAGVAGWVIVPISVVAVPAPQPVVVDGYILGAHGDRCG